MTLALRCFIAGLATASTVAYLYKPDFIVVVVAFVLGHLLGLAVAWIGVTMEGRE